MMQVLYHVSSSERKELFKKLHEQWLTTGGRVVVVSASRTKCPSGTAYEIDARLGSPVMSWEDIEHDILEAGFIRQLHHEMLWMRNFTNLDEHTLRFYQKHINETFTLDDIRNAIKELYPEEKSYPMFENFAVFQNT